MKLTALLLAASALLSSNVLANNCYEPYAWCGWDLLEEGDYLSYIKAGLRAQGIQPTKHNINQSLWQCTNSDTGDASFIELCRSCKYGGNSQSDDFCGGKRTKNRRTMKCLAEAEE